MMHLLAILAAYRVARMLALEDGPLDVFAHLRARLDPEQTTWLGRGVNCPLCIGFWVSLIFAAMLPFADWQTFIITWLAIAGGQTFLHEVAP